MSRADGTFAVRLLTAASAVSEDVWNRLAGDDNPFAQHAFATALEDSGSAAAATGWQPAHLAIEYAGQIAALVPGYVKSHSQGEYVFDHGWADAFERAGGRYYPKFQMAVPFTPATGPRLLASNEADRRALAAAAEAFCRTHNISSAHATFLADDDALTLAAAGWLPRLTEQFHWFNRDYACFDDFLAALSSRKRKTIRRERREALDSGLSIVELTGNQITEVHWDAFWTFYQDTGSRKWGRPYLTRSFFSLLGERMADRVLLILAYDGRRPVAGALNLIGRTCLFGRYWGAVCELPFLHFELCYYRAIDYAIRHRLARVEAGAQGPHKLARGYEPVATRSAHYIVNPQLRRAVTDYLDREREVIAADIDAMSAFTPFRQTGLK
jgi:predicted N-acyltransferase